jgi:hypothetical protein
LSGPVEAILSPEDLPVTTFSTRIGIWKLERGVLVLCWRREARGYPQDFGGEGREDVVTLGMK